MKLAYPVRLEPDDNDTLFVTCPDLPEVKSFGDDQDDALRHAVDAIEEALAARIAYGEDIPPPSIAKRKQHLVVLPTQTALKVALYCLLKDSGITRAELSRRLEWKRESVDRLFRLDHATRLEQYDAAFKALGRRIRVEVEEAA